jgi:hypothetical protein
LANAQRRGSRRVCSECRGRGFSAKDVESYTCHLCGQLGHAKFKPKDVQKTNPYFLSSLSFDFPFLFLATRGGRAWFFWYWFLDFWRFF